MQTTVTTEMEELLSDEETEICGNCENVYKVILLKESNDWNDFGIRHCPFCGMLTQE